jgi:dihydroorotase
MAVVDLVIKNARLVLPDNIFKGGVAVEKSKIVKIARSSSLPKAEKIVDALGNFLFPGLIDVHVHFRDFEEKEKEDWSNGSKAAVAGGVTTVLDMPNNKPAITSRELLEKKGTIASKKSLVNFGFHFAATNENVDEIKKVEGISSVKFYIGSTTGDLLIENAKIFEYFNILGKRKILATIHGEDEQMLEYYEKIVKAKGKKDVLSYADSRPNICASEAMNKIIYFSKFFKNEVHFCHVSTFEEVDLLRKHHFKWLSSEVTPHHLLLSKKHLKKLKGFGKVNPPLRSEKDRKELWKAIHDNTIKIIASDHAPHLKEEKRRENIWDVPAGIPGVETLFPLLLNEVSKKRITSQKIAKLVAENPAKIFGIKRKGKIQEGYDADLVLVDLKKEKTVKNEDLFTKCSWSPFDGWKLKGWPIKTFVLGNLVFDDGEIINEEVKGKKVEFLKRRKGG